MTQTWAEIVWCHWRVPMSAMDGRFPPGVHAQEHDGSAWVGLVPFEMRDLRLVAAGRALPTVPTTGAFSEVNVRTYVTGPAGPGVWFDTLDASTPLGAIVARVAWSLPYVRSRITGSVDEPRRTDEAPDPHPRRAWSVERVGGTTARIDARASAPRPNRRHSTTSSRSATRSTRGPGGHPAESSGHQSTMPPGRSTSARRWMWTPGWSGRRATR